MSESYGKMNGTDHSEQNVETSWEEGVRTSIRTQIQRIIQKEIHLEDDKYFSYASLVRHGFPRIEGNSLHARIHQFRRIASICVEELLFALYAAQRSSNNEQLQAVYQCAEQILLCDNGGEGSYLRDILFEDADLSVQIRAAAYLSRSSFIEKRTGIIVVQCLLDSISNINRDDGLPVYDEKYFQKEIHTIQSLSIPEALDVLHLCQTLKALERAGIQDAAHTMADRLSERIEAIFKKAVQACPTSSFIEYEAALIRQRTKEEEEHPSVNRDTYYKSTARIQDRKDKTDMDIHGIYPDHFPGKGEYIQQISSDAVAIFSTSGLPYLFGNIEQEAIMPDQQISPLHVHQALELLTKDVPLSALWKIHRSIVMKGHSAEEGVSVWHAMHPEFTKEEWDELLGLAQDEQRIKAMYARSVRHIKYEKEESIHEIQKSVCGRIEQAISMAQQNRWSDVPESLHHELDELYQKFHSCLQKDILDSALGYGDKIEFILDNKVSTRSDHAVFIQDIGWGPIEARATQKRYHSVRNSAKNKKAEAKQQMELHLHALRTNNADLYRRFEMSKEVIVAGMQTYLTQLDSSLKRRLGVVHFQDYAAIEHMHHLNPFPQAVQENIPLLLQHLHRPGMRRMIEEDLGISFTGLPLQSQIHLLRFLLDKDKKTFARFRNVIQHHPQPRHILHSFLACSESVGIGNIILDLAEHENTLPVIQAYATLVEQAEEGATQLERMYRKAVPDGATPRSAFFQVLIRQANIYLSNFFRTLQKMQNIVDEEERQRHITDAVENFVASLQPQDKYIRQTKDLVSALPRKELTRLNLKELETVQLEGPIPVEEFRRNPQYASVRERVLDVIKKQFTNNDDTIFQEKFLQKPGAQFFYSTCGKERKLMAFFGTEPMENGYTYIDWLNADPKAPVRGLTQATVMTALKGIERTSDTYNVAKPHVGSFPFAIEEFGSVCFGATDDGEYQHHYLRCRKTKAEDGYIGKVLTAEHIEHLKSLCVHKNALHDAEVNGTPLKVCTVEFGNKNHKHDISSNDKEYGFIFRTVQELCEKQGYVLSRYIPMDSTLLQQTYLCIFEPSRLPEGERRQLEETLKSFYDKQED